MANLKFDFLHAYETGERRESEPANAYQYDEGHVLEAVLPSAVTSCEIHYWIRGQEKSEAYTPGSITQNADGSCTVTGNIPNLYFETNGELRVYIVVTDGSASITTYEGFVHICQRSMPDDYVDDDPENEATRVLIEAQTAAATATAAAETCEEVLKSIPEDYSTLSDDVSDLKDGLTAVESDVTDLKDDFTQLQGNVYTESISANLLYLNTVKQNYYISNTNGQEVNYNNWGATDFMPVVGGEDYVFIGCYSVGGMYEYIRTDYFAFYDNQKSFISGGFNSRGVITAPSNAAYIRESTNLPAFTTAMYATMFGLNSDLGSFIGQKTKADYIEPETEFIPSEFLKNTVNDIVGHTVRVETDGSGDFSTLKDAVEYSASHEDTTILVGNGTYDLITEFGTSYFSGMTTSNQRQGLQIGNGVHIIFSSGAKVTAHYTGDNDAVKTCFSPFNFIQGTKGFTLENLTIEASNVRYIVHDEAGNTATPKHYKNVYKNCNMTIDNSQNTNWTHHQCIGGGLGLHGEIIIEDCIFTDLYNINYRVPAVSYHNAAGAGAKSRIVIKGCWFSKDATARISWYGTSTEITEAIVHDNSMTVAPYASAETSSATVENVQLLAWNNEIRS